MEHTSKSLSRRVNVKQKEKKHHLLETEKQEIKAKFLNTKYSVQN
jgi:hypothetical protein